MNDQIYIRNCKMHTFIQYDHRPKVVGILGQPYISDNDKTINKPNTRALQKSFVKNDMSFPF